MKKLIKVAILCLTAAVGCLALVPAGKTVPEPASSSGELVSPSSVYRAHCARCHGNDGRSNTAKGREMDADDLTTSRVKGMDAGRVASIIKNGKGDMPGFGRKLSAAQIAALVRYVKTL